MEIHTKYKIVWRDRGRLKRLGRLWRLVEIHANTICVERPNETRLKRLRRQWRYIMVISILYTIYNTQD